MFFYQIHKSKRATVNIYKNINIQENCERFPQAADDSREWMGQSALGQTFVGKLGSSSLAAVMGALIVAAHITLGLMLKIFFFTYKKN